MASDVKTFTDAQVDAGAEALRQRLQGSQKHLVEWSKLPNSTKKKWREYARIVLDAADVVNTNDDLVKALEVIATFPITDPSRNQDAFNMQKVARDTLSRARGEAV